MKPFISERLLVCLQGMGKTISVISLCLFNRGPKGSPTLIVCPTGVLDQWREQFQIFVKEEQRFKTFTFHGTEKDGITAEYIADRYEVVFTTYDTLKIGVDTCDRKEGDDGDVEEDASATPLFQVHWHRVVLDECQLMRNEKTDRAAASCRLESRSRWLLSGTPIQNKLGEARSYFKFLRYRPFALADDVAFQPDPDGRPSSLLLRHWNAISLRRVKGT